MGKFYKYSIFAALFLFTVATSFEISFSLSPKHKIPPHLAPKPASNHNFHLTLKDASEIPHSIKPKVASNPAPNKHVSAHLAPKSAIKQNLHLKPTSNPREKSKSKSSLGPQYSHVSKLTKLPHSSKFAPRLASRKYFPTHLAPKSSIGQNLSPKIAPKPIEKHTSNSILAPHSHVSSSKPIPHSTSKVTITSPSKSKFAPRPAPNRYFPTHLTPKIPSKQSFPPQPLFKSSLAPHSHVSSKLTPLSTPKITKTSFSKSKFAPQPASIKRLSPHSAPRILSKFPSVSFTTLMPKVTKPLHSKSNIAPNSAPKKHLAPEISTKLNRKFKLAPHLKGKIGTKSRLAPHSSVSSRLTRKLSPKPAPRKYIHQ